MSEMCYIHDVFVYEGQCSRCVAEHSECMERMLFPHDGIKIAGGRFINFTDWRRFMMIGKGYFPELPQDGETPVKITSPEQKKRAIDELVKEVNEADKKRVETEKQQLAAREERMKKYKLFS